VEVNSGSGFGIPEAKWRRWGLAIQTLLSTRGGTISEAIQSWRKNINKELEGVEACPICYSILQPKSRRLPNTPCPTCSYYFHASCIHRWFRSSGHNKCPMCREPFF